MRRPSSSPFLVSLGIVLLLSCQGLATAKLLCPDPQPGPWARPCHTTLTKVSAMASVAAPKTKATTASASPTSTSTKSSKSPEGTETSKLSLFIFSAASPPLPSSSSSSSSSAKPQATGLGFIGVSSSVASCANAAVYELSAGGQLKMSDSVAIAADSFMEYRPFVPGQYEVGTYSTTFALDGASRLSWRNASFYGGEATFCKAGSRVMIVFVELADGPEGCVAVDVVAYAAGRCVEGLIV